MRKLLQKIITLFTFLLFFLFLLDFGFSEGTECKEKDKKCNACETKGLDGKGLEACKEFYNDRYTQNTNSGGGGSNGGGGSSDEGAQDRAPIDEAFEELGSLEDTETSLTSAQINNFRVRFPDLKSTKSQMDTEVTNPLREWYKLLLEEKIAALDGCDNSDLCYYDEDTDEFKINDFGIDTVLKPEEINARLRLDDAINSPACTPGSSDYSRTNCNRAIKDASFGIDNSTYSSGQNRAQSHLIGDRNWFWYLFQGEDAAATFTLNKYGVNLGLSPQELEGMSEPIFSKICLKNNGMDIDDIRPSYFNEVDDVNNGESLFDFRGSVINLIPVDEDLEEGEGYVKYSYYFKKPEKSVMGEFNTEFDNDVNNFNIAGSSWNNEEYELQTLSKRNIAVVLFYNKMNRSDDDDDFDVYGYYEVISDPDVIELNSENPIVSSGIELVYVDEVYLDRPNFRIAFYYRDYFEVEGGEKKQENLRIWTSSSSLPNAVVIPEQIKSLEDTTSSSTDNSINEEGASSSGSGSLDEGIYEDYLSGIS